MKIVVTLSPYQAEALGILKCKCGHPPNNHFDFDERPCAHCDCKGYEGKIVLPPDKEEK